MQGPCRQISSHFHRPADWHNLKSQHVFCLHIQSFLLPGSHPATENVFCCPPDTPPPSFFLFSGSFCLQSQPFAARCCPCFFSPLSTKQLITSRSLPRAESLQCETRLKEARRGVFALCGCVCVYCCVCVRLVRETGAAFTVCSLPGRIYCNWVAAQQLLQGCSSGY